MHAIAIAYDPVVFVSLAGSVPLCASVHLCRFMCLTQFMCLSCLHLVPFERASLKRAQVKVTAILYGVNDFGFAVECFRWS